MERLHVLIAFAVAGLCCGRLSAQTVSIAVAQNMSFPTIAIPNAGTVSLAVSPLNSSTSGTATILYGTATRGQYNLAMSENGGAAVAISVNVSDASVSNPNVTLGTFTGLYSSTQISSFPSPTLQLPAASPAFTPLYLGATIGANQDVTAGAVTASFTLTVTVQ